MSRSRSGLWVEIALALALLTLATIVLNAGVFWLLIKKTEESRRTELAVSLTGALAAQLSVAAEREASGRTAAIRKVIAAYESTALDIDQLYVVAPSMEPLAVLAGSPPATPDVGLRAALFAHESHAGLEGSLVGRRWVAATAPVAPKGRVIGALRVRMPLHTPLLPGGPAGFVLSYTALSGALIALFGFSLFQRRLLGPVAVLKGGTERIAAGDFGHQITVDAARELTELSEALSAMSLSLADYRARTADQLARLGAANDELRQTQEALVRSEKLAGVGRLAAGLAHELGNPLAAVIATVELLQQGLGDPALERDLLLRARKELDRIHTILRQLLDYARPGDGAVRPVDVAAAVEEAFATVGPQPAARAVALVAEVPPGLPPVRIEPEKLHQVLVNLVLNAIDAIRGPAGAAPGTVTLRAAPADPGALPAGPGDAPAGAVRIACGDTGPGFSALALERALEPFFSTKEPGQGTGLGLATCLQVIEAAGGRLQIANGAAGGGEVVLLLPVAAAGGGPGEGADG